MAASQFNPRKWLAKKFQRGQESGDKDKHNVIPCPTVSVDGQNLILHGMLAGYFEQDGMAVVDEMFFGTELNRKLLEMGLRVRWEAGVADTLEQQDSIRRAVPPRFARVYQLRPEVDPRLKFAPYEAVLALFGPPVRERYQIVYDGPAPKGNLDDICDTLSENPSGGFTGHSPAISDILEFYGDGSREFFYIDSYGYRKIEF